MKTQEKLTKREAISILVGGIICIGCGIVAIWGGYKNYLQARLSSMDLSREEIKNILNEKGFNLSLSENIPTCGFKETLDCITYIPYGEQKDNFKMEMGEVSALRNKWRGEQEELLIFAVNSPPNGAYRDLETTQGLTQKKHLFKLGGHSQSKNWEWTRFTIEDEEESIPVHMTIELPPFDENQLYQLFIGEGHMQVTYPKLVSGGWDNAVDNMIETVYFYVVEPEDIGFVSRLSPIRIPWGHFFFGTLFWGLGIWFIISSIKSLRVSVFENDS